MVVAHKYFLQEYTVTTCQFLPFRILWEGRRFGKESFNPIQDFGPNGVHCWIDIEDDKVEYPTERWEEEKPTIAQTNWWVF